MRYNSYKMKILLLGFNVQDDVFPLGLTYLKEYARKYHPDVDIQLKEFSFGNRYNYETNKNVELQALSFILMQQPDVVALSCYIWSGEMAQNFAAAIKKVNPNITVVLGGVEVHDGLLTDSIDFIIQGEAEIAFKELIDHLKGLRSVEDVGNIIHRGGRNAVKTIEDLDDLPFPYTSIHNKTDYAVVRLETARGCLFNCNFCHYAKPKLRYFSVDYLQRNIPLLFQNYSFKNLTILDANFNSNKERMKEILDIIEENVKDKLLVHMELRPELIDEALVENLKRYSFSVSVELGLQSTDPDVLKLANRPTNIEKVKLALSLLEKHGIKYKIDLMHGLPGDNFFKFLNSMRFVIEHAPKQNKVISHHYMLLNNTSFFESNTVERLTPSASSMVVKTNTQDVVDLYKTKLFVDMVNWELKCGK